MWKALGEGTSAAERDVETILAGVPRWRGAKLRYRPVSGGISNANWQVSSGALPDCFVKVPGRGTEMFITRTAANEASRKAHACGFGAKVIDFLPACRAPPPWPSRSTTCCGAGRPSPAFSRAGGSA